MIPPEIWVPVVTIYAMFVCVLVLWFEEETEEDEP